MPAFCPYGVEPLFLSWISCSWCRCTCVGQWEWRSAKWTSFSKSHLFKLANFSFHEKFRSILMRRVKRACTTHLCLLMPLCASKNFWHLLRLFEFGKFDDDLSAFLFYQQTQNLVSRIVYRVSCIVSDKKRNHWLALIEVKSLICACTVSFCHDFWNLPRN